MARDGNMYGFSLKVYVVLILSVISCCAVRNEFLIARNDKIRDDRDLMTDLAISKFPRNHLIDNVIPDVVKVNLSELLGRLSEVNDSKQCGENLIFMLFNIHEKFWALSMVDAFGKPGSGILDGNLIWPGSYFQCENITNINATTSFFSGQYCWAKFELGPSVKKAAHMPPTPMDLTLQTALCIPDSCSPKEVKEIFHFISESLTFLPKYLNLTNVDCIPRTRNIWKDKGAVISFAIICIFLLLLTMGTFYDLFYYRKKKIHFLKYNDSVYDIDPDKENPGSSGNEMHADDDSVLLSGDVDVKIIPAQRFYIGIFGEILLSFSVYENGAKILNLLPGKRTLTSLNGIRFFSMTWIILGHTFLMGSLLIDNPLILLDVMKTLGFQIVTQANLAVDSFFLLSGLLVAYLFCKEYENKNGNISWLKFYVHRYLRLTPVYLLVMFLLVSNLAKYFSQGPFWPSNGFEQDNCSKNWWWNVLYINNFISIEKMCMGQSWYLANDMQFYIFSPIILIPLAKKSIIGTSVVAGALIIISSVCSGVLSSHYNISAAIDLTKVAPGSKDYNNLFNIIYDKPYCRMGSYIIGMICGCLLQITKCKVIMKKQWVILGWAAAIICNLSVTLGLYHSHPSQAISSLYFALARIAWSTGLSWVIFACCTGYGGFVDRILSWNGWNPFSRVTYSVYLIHVMIIEAVFYSSEVISHFSYTNLIFYHIAFVIVTYVLGFIVSLAFESPFLALEKLLFTQRQ